MPEFLFEIFSEEIPARFQKSAADDLHRLFTEKLAAQGLAFSHAEAHVTPRRLMLVVDGLPLEQPARVEEKKGPKVGAPPAAIDGFLKSAGLTSLTQCAARQTPKGEIWFATAEIPGRPTAEVLAGLIAPVMHEMPWPKSMNWGQGSFRWVRPIHSILALFDGQTLQGEFPLGGRQPALVFGDTTEGHRFMSRGRFNVTGFADYRNKLRADHVILDRDERKERVREGAITALAAKGAILTTDDALLEEVAGLVEWPVSLAGRIDDAFMDIPPEVLTSTMRNNQKYFVSAIAGRFSPWFVITANCETADDGTVIIGGNERVLRARLADARFFWDLDRRTKLAEFAQQLGKVTFHAKLGTVAQKVARMEKLAGLVAAHISADSARAQTAAALSKADLVTGMVGEFPELQGIMGGYYARHKGLGDDIATAIQEHYMPLGPNDRCPGQPLSIAVAMADKLDTVTGFFAIQEYPTGSKDPYALRRAALGIIRLVTENQLGLDLMPLFREAWRLHQVGELAETSNKLRDFFIERLKVVWRDRGASHDLISALFAEKNGSFDIVDCMDRLAALQAMLNSADGKALLGLYRRAANILRIEEARDKCRYTGAVDQLLLVEVDEQKLGGALENIALSLARLLEKEDYVGIMQTLVTLRPFLDDFFANVTVNDNDQAIRQNRLRLLAKIRDTFHRIADFSQIEGD